MKKVVITIIIVIVVGVSFYFVNKKYDILEKFGVGKSDYKYKEEPEPELQIVDEDSDSRIIAVMINNHHDAWPHAGLQDSFLNYEIVAEGGITRIMALFKDKDTAQIGSVRSARHYYLDYALENDAIYVHFGHSPKALSDISTLDIDNINGMYDSAGFWRDRTLGRDYEHTAFTSMEKIKNVIERKGYRTTTDKDLLLNYSVKEISLKNGERVSKADKVEIEYSSYQTTSYVYDEENKVYLRYMDDEAHVDLLTNEHYTAKNIIVYQVKNYSIDSSGRQDLENIGSGEGYYITNGYAIPIKWTKESRNSQTVYTYMNGQEITVNDGNTWIQIQPKGGKLDITGNEVSDVENNE